MTAALTTELEQQLLSKVDAALVVLDRTVEDIPMVAEALEFQVFAGMCDPQYAAGFKDAMRAAEQYFADIREELTK